MDLAVVGLGKVGLVLSVALASAGHKVIGIDVDAARVAAIRERSIKTAEPGITEGLRALSVDDLDATTDAGVVANVDAVFVIVPTPSAPDGGFELDFVLSAIDLIGPGLRANPRGGPVVSLVSTVMPGASDTVIIPALEQAAGRTLGDRLGYGYNPAFIALGDVLQGFVSPDLVLIGEADEHSGDLLARIHATMVPVHTPVVRMRPVEAEIAKLASNAHETMRVAFVNMLLAACESTPGSDVDAITDALTFRHGRRLFRGAVPYGGPCWPRDNFALSSYLESVGAPSRLPAAVHQANDDHGGYLVNRIRAVIPPDSTHVVVAGLAYKTGTEVLDEAFGLWLARELATDDRLRITGWDPMAAEGARMVLPESVSTTSELAECVADADVLIVAQPAPELSAFDWSIAKPGIVVIDCWRRLHPVHDAIRSGYRALGSTRYPSGVSQDGIGLAVTSRRPA